MNKELEDILHVACTNIAIILCMADIIVKGLKKKEPVFAIMIVSLFIIFTITLLLNDVKNHTYYIEVLGITVFFVYYYNHPSYIFLNFYAR